MHAVGQIRRPSFTQVALRDNIEINHLRHLHLYLTDEHVQALVDTYEEKELVVEEYIATATILNGLVKHYLIKEHYRKRGQTPEPEIQPELTSRGRYFIKHYILNPNQKPQAPSNGN